MSTRKSRPLTKAEITRFQKVLEIQRKAILGNNDKVLRNDFSIHQDDLMDEADLARLWSGFATVFMVNAHLAEKK